MSSQGTVTGRARVLASSALAAAITEDWDKVSEVMNALNRETGGAGTTHALICWCDWHIILQRRLQGLPDFPRPEEVAVPRWLNADTGHVDRYADDVPAPARWAGQVIAARAAMDRDTFSALLAAMPDDGYERARYALVILRSCATLARNAPERTS